MRCSKHPGFTLIEVLFATGIFVLVVGGLGTLLIGVQRLTKKTISQVELSVRGREVREKLLFHVAPPHNGKVWSGLLSGADENAVIEGNGAKVKMYVAWGYDGTQNQPVAQRIELVKRTAGNGNDTVCWFGNDADRVDDGWKFKWLCPGGLSNLPAADYLSEPTTTTPNLFCVNLEMSARGVQRRERIVVPCFGTVQATTGSGRVFRED